MWVDIHSIRSTIQSPLTRLSSFSCQCSLHPKDLANENKYPSFPQVKTLFHWRVSALHKQGVFSNGSMCWCVSQKKSDCYIRLYQHVMTFLEFLSNFFNLFKYFTQSVKGANWGQILKYRQQSSKWTEMTIGKAN